MGDAGGARAGTVTVMFTDVVESTALRQALGDDRADRLRREHDRLVRQATAQHRGTEVKALGDGFMLVFGAAVEAVGAAISIQRAIERLSRRSTEPLRIRVGISAGDVVWEDDDCFGTPVVEASRLCAAADAGQILASDVVRVLAGTRGDHRYVSRGDIALKGLAAPLPTAEVLWEEQRDARPPLPSALLTAGQVAFVGRTSEREHLVRTWKDAASGTRRVAFVSGEPGVGKTRLAGELARLAHDEGAIVLYGRCDEDLGVPYQPFVEALRPYVAHVADDELAAQVAPYGGDLARLVPQIAERVPDLPDALRAEPETERYRLFDAVTSWLARIASGAPVLLVLDDLHWAAKPTLLMLRHLTRTEWSGPLLLLATYRDTDLSRTHPLADMLADLRRSPEVERLALHGLDADEVVTFLSAAAGHELDREGMRLARLIHDETEGNPFFMGQVLRHLVETGTIVERDGRWSRGVAGDDLGIPEGVREVVGRRLARLDPATNDVLAAAAVIGREFDRDILTTAASADGEAVLDALEEAEEARLVTAVGGLGRYAFVHALVRSTLYDEIPTTRRLRLHRRVAETLEVRDADAHLDELAHHFAEAAALGETAKALEYGRRAAQRALDRLAYEEAAADYERALASLDPERSEDRATRAELLVDIGRAVWIGGERARARQHLDEAIALARECGRADVFADAVITSGGIRAWTEAGLVDERLVQLMEETLTLLPPGDSGLRAMVTARLAAELYFAEGADDRRRALSDEAIAMARRLGDVPTLAYVLSAAHWGMFVPGNAPQRVAAGRELLAVAEASNDRGAEVVAHSWLLTDFAEIGDVDAVREHSARETELSDALRQPELRWGALVHASALATLTGRLDDAQRFADEALAVGQQVGIQSTMQMYGVTQMALRRLRGGLEELVPLVAAMVEEYPLVPAWRSGLAYLYRELGDVEHAREQLEVLAVDEFAALPPDGNWMVGAAILATVCHLVGDRARAAVLYDQLSRYEDAVVLAGLPADILGSAHHFLMLLAATSEDWDDFERHAREALACNERMGARPWLATTQAELAGVLLARDRPDDRERADRLLEACLATCRELDMPALASRAEAIRDAAGDLRGARIQQG